MNSEHRRWNSRRSRWNSRHSQLEVLESRSMLAVTPVAADWLLADLPKGPEVSSLLDSATDADGNLFVLGRFNGSVDFDPGPAEDILVASQYDIFLAKYDSLGNFVDATDLGDITSSFWSGIFIDDAGHIYLASNYTGTATLMNGPTFSSASSGGTSGLIAKIDNDLQSILWATNVSLAGFGPYSSGEVRMGDIGVDSSGASVYIAGRLTGEGEVAGTTQKFDFDTFVWKIDAADGSFDWSRLVPNTSGNNEGALLSVDPLDSAAVFAYLPQDQKVVKLDSDGNVVWDKSLPVRWEDFEVYDGALYATGAFSGELTIDSQTVTSSGATDVFVAMLDADTNQATWIMRAGGIGDDAGRHLIVDPMTGVFVSGTFSATATFGTDQVVARTPYEEFLTQLDSADGAYRQAWRFGPARDSVDLSAVDGAVYMVGHYGPDAADFPNGTVIPPTTRGRYVMRFSPTLDGTVPRINGFAAHPRQVHADQTIDLAVEALFDPNQRVDGMAFYHDVDGDYQLTLGVDSLIGTDTDGTDGWGVPFSTSGLAYGDVQFFAQAIFDGGAVSSPAYASALVTAPPVTYESTDVGLPIRDRMLYVTSSSLVVPDNFELADVDVKLNITHSYVGDLTVRVVHPDGASVYLLVEVGGSGDNFTDTILDDQAAIPIGSVTANDAPFRGRYQPENPLSYFNGKASAGTWKLEIQDSYKGDHGTLDGWSLDLTPREPLPPTLSIDDVQVTEGNDGATIARFTIVRTGDLSQSASVDVASSNGTATSGDDYIPLAPTTIVFAPSIGSVTVDVIVSSDTTEEPDETFFVNLSNPIGATLDDDQGVATIVNDDYSVTTDLLYVFDIRFESRRGGKDYRAVFEIRVDSNHDGVGTSADAPAVGTSIVASFAGRTFTGVTDSNGLFRTSWESGISPGTYYANVVDLLLAGHLWGSSLDLEDDSDNDGKADAALVL